MSYDESLKAMMESYSENPSIRKAFCDGVDWSNDNHWHRCDEGDLADDEAVITAIFDVDEKGNFIIDGEPIVCFNHKSHDVGVLVDDNHWCVLFEGTKVAYWCQVPKMNSEFVKEIKSCVEKK